MERAAVFVCKWTKSKQTSAGKHLIACKFNTAKNILIIMFDSNSYTWAGGMMATTLNVTVSSMRKPCSTCGKVCSLNIILQHFKLCFQTKINQWSTVPKDNADMKWRCMVAISTPTLYDCNKRESPTKTSFPLTFLLTGSHV